jgi:hypothetical protein
MERFRQIVFNLTVPMNVFLVVWVWVGRGLFGATLGWIAAFFTVLGLPIMIVTLGLATVLVLRQPRSAPRLSKTAAWLQVGLWTALLLAGATIVDVDDINPEESLLINLIGFSGDTLSLSMELTKVFAFSAMFLWLGLVGALVNGIAAGKRVAESPDPA